MPYFVNLWQTAEDRRAKYALVRSLGGSRGQATRCKDWRISKIERLYNLVTTNKQKPTQERLALLFTSAYSPTSNQPIGKDYGKLQGSLI